MHINLLLIQAEQITKIVQPDSIFRHTSKNETVQLIRQGRYEEVLNNIVDWSITFGGKLIIAFALFWVGKWLIKKIKTAIIKVSNKRHMDGILRSFLGSLLNVILYTILIILIVNAVGVQTVSFAAILGAMGLAIGFSVKDNLSNFAGGIMILANQPFKIGDYIESQSQKGIVTSVGILYTQLRTFDNTLIYIPNGPLSTGNIINYNAEATRRVDLKVSVEYGSDVETVKEILLSLASAHPKVLDNPKPFARMSEMSDNSIDFTFRVWALTENQWDVFYDLNEQIYTKLLEKGLNIPFPQLTIHMADGDISEGDNNAQDLS